MQRMYRKNIELILIFCSVLILFASPTFAWLSGWDYRQAINISNTAGDLTNYQVRIDLNSTNVGSNFNWSNNGSDIRFTDASDNLLNFWIESWNSTEQEATIWVNVTSLPNNTNTTIYMYYGNPSASSVSNGSAVFEFFDDFEDGNISDWTTTSGTTSVVSGLSGNYAIKHTGDGTNNIGQVVYKSYTVPDSYIFECEFMLDDYGTSTYEPYFYIFLPRYVDANNLIRVDSYYSTDQYIRYWKIVEGSYSAIAAATWISGGQAEKDKIYKFKYVSKGSTVDIYIDDVKYISDATKNTEVSAGKIGFGANVNAQLIEDNMRIRKYADPEPTVSSFGSEEIFAGIIINVYDNQTNQSLTNWTVYFTNGTDEATFTNQNNPAKYHWSTIPYGEINITISDGSDTKYYYNYTFSTINNETNLQTFDIYLEPKGNNTITLTADPSWQVEVGTQVTISCSALETTPTLYKDGVIVSSPYTSTYAFGTYVFNCSTEETENYRPTTVTKTLNVLYPFGCINTEYGNQTFAYYSVVYTDYNLTTLNFTGLVSQGLVKSDLSDVYAYADTKSNNLTIWTNTTNGYYVIVNNTGYSNFTILFGNYFINNTGYFAGTHALTDIVEFSVNEYDKKYTVEFFDEITGEQGLPPNSTKYLTVYCSGGTASNLKFNSSKITFATSSLADEITVYVEYSPQERYSRTVIPETPGYYKMFLVDANNYQVAQMLLTVDDYTGEFGSNTTILKIKKETQGVLSTITERRLDAESKAIVYLIVDDKYSVYVDNGQEERGIGLLYVDTTDLTKTITIGTAVSLNKVGDFKFVLGYNNQTHAIYMRVEDPLNQTLNASIWIYNYTSGELLYHASSTNHTTIEFTYIVPDANGTYRVEYHIAHSVYGEHSIAGGQVFALGDLFPVSFPFEFPFAGDVQSEIGLTWQLFVVIMILIGITMMFGAVNGSFAGVFIVIMGWIMSHMGWWSPNPMIMAVALIFAIVNLMAERLRKK